MKKIIINIVLISAIPFVLVCYFIALSKYISDFATRGQFGDMFGAANALFSGFAFLGIIYTIHLQRKELGLQREELKLTRDELARSAKAQEESHIALTRQAESLKLTAKLNGLSSMLEFELSKYNDDRAKRKELSYSSLIKPSLSRAENIVNQIQGIIDDK